VIGEQIVGTVKLWLNNHPEKRVLQAKGIADSIIMAITGHKTHVMLHRYSHSDDAIRIAALDALPEPPKARTNLRG
jgi:hypothetical protein